MFTKSIIKRSLLCFKQNPFASAFSRMQMTEKRARKEEERKEAERQKELKKIILKEEAEMKDVEIDPKKRVFTSPLEVLNELKTVPLSIKNETVDIVIGLNIDIKKGDQMVRGMFKMPGGSNKIPKLCVFTSDPFKQIAKDAGADMIGDTETLRQIKEGEINFDKCVCTIDMLPTLKQLGRILGPKGLMPNPKLGTACTSDNLESTIKDVKLGTREFRPDESGQIFAPLGRRTWPDQNLLFNLDSLMKALSEKKPESIKGRYFLYAFMTSHGRSFRLDMKSLDPKSASYFINEIKDK